MSHLVIARRLKELLSDQSLNATDLSRMSGVKTSFIYDVLSGKSKNPSIITLAKIANTLGVPLAELAGQVDQHHPSHQPEQAAYTAIAPLDGTANADAQHYMFTRSWITNTLGSTPEHLRALTIASDGMEPTMNHGDMVLIDTSKTAPSPPGIFALHDGFGLVVKRLEVTASNPSTRLRITSDNPQYNTSEAALTDINIIGRVVWFARSL